MAIELLSPVEEPMKELTPANDAQVISALADDATFLPREPIVLRLAQSVYVEWATRTSMVCNTNLVSPNVGYGPRHEAML